jgi:hypothetical protein
VNRSLTPLCLAVLAGALLVGAAPAPPAAALSFAPHVEHFTGSGTTPFFVATADVNGDRKTDVVTVNQVADSVSVLLGDGRGGLALAPGSPVAVGDGPLSCATGDFNSDGKLDLVTPNYNADTVTVLLGDGAGGFAPAPASPWGVGNSPRQVAVGYFDSDANADLAVVNVASDNVTVLLGDGAGNFSAASGSPFSTGVSSAPAALVAADFDGNGTTDLAASLEVAASVAVLLGNGDGTFGAPTAFAVGTYPLAVAAADFDGDGRPDLATSNYSSNTVSVLLNTTTGGTLSFATQAVYFACPIPYWLATGDLDGDGAVDLTVGCSGSFGNTFRVLLGDGAGGLWPPIGLTAGYGPIAVAVGDFNGGQLDLVAGNFVNNSTSVSVLLNTTKSRITAIKPAKGRPGATVTIAGTGFGALRGKAKVYFGSKVAGKYPLWSATKIKVKVPKTTAGKVTAKVKTVEGKSNGKSFKVL